MNITNNQHYPCDINLRRFSVHMKCCFGSDKKRAGDFNFGFQGENAKSVFDSRIWARLVWVCSLRFWSVRKIREHSPAADGPFSKHAKIKSISRGFFHSFTSGSTKCGNWKTEFVCKGKSFLWNFTIVTVFDWSWRGI